MRPADELRAAAKVLRETASNATPGPWADCSTAYDGAWPVMVIGQPGPDDDRGQDVLVVPHTVDEDIVVLEDVAWIVLANPALAKPLAVLLEDLADFVGEFDKEPPAGHLIGKALAVARAINGSTS